MQYNSCWKQNSKLLSLHKKSGKWIWLRVLANNQLTRTNIYQSPKQPDHSLAKFFFMPNSTLYLNKHVYESGHFLPLKTNVKIMALGPDKLRRELLETTSWLNQGVSNNSLVKLGGNVTPECIFVQYLPMPQPQALSVCNLIPSTCFKHDQSPVSKTLLIELQKSS